MLVLSGAVIVLVWVETGQGGESVAAAPLFLSAQPVWPKGRATEMNVTAGFRAAFDAPAEGKAGLRVAAATIYRAWINGEFLGCGPARAAHGYFRVDQWDLSGHIRPGKNLLVIEVAGYNCNSYYLLDQPSFLQAEVFCGFQTLASTAGGGVPFVASVRTERVQKVQRYSFQRPFVESYRLSPETERWRSDMTANDAVAETDTLPPVKLLPRGVPYPTLTVWKPVQNGPNGRLEVRATVGHYRKDRSLTRIGPKLKGFPEAELDVVLSDEVQRSSNAFASKAFAPCAGDATLTLQEKGFAMVDFGTDRAGFLMARIEAERPARVWLQFAERLTPEGDLAFNVDCCNIVECRVQPGAYRFQSMEPYVLRYAKVICLEGACRVKDLALRECARPPTEAAFRCSDEWLNRLFEAANLSSRQNVLDLFMDCPSRERGGWLCDSFFTARGAADLTGSLQVERNFFENFMLPKAFADIPDGMLPMCYPADHNDGCFIPNWALWFVVQLGEYADRGGDPAIVAGLKDRVMRLFGWFTKYENSDGLLENLPGWVFISYSANDFTQQVNYPTCMLYAGALSAAARLYGDDALKTKSGRVREAVCRQSFDGRFFVDNAVRRDGVLRVTTNRTEACQCYAFFFDVATPDSHAGLWKTLLDEFGPKRRQTKTFPEVRPGEPFVDWVMRMDLLSRAGRSGQIVQEAIDYWLPQAELTGTLWEYHVPTSGSLCHGFPSSLARNLHRDVLGVARIDPKTKSVMLRFADLPLAFCEGAVPAPDGAVRLQWRQTADRITYRAVLPTGYCATVENASGKRLVSDDPEIKAAN